MKLEAFLPGNRSSGSGIDSAAEKQDSVFACHIRRLGNFCPFHRVVFLIPADDAFVENFHVTVTLFIENAISQTGQVVGASSIQDKQLILGNFLHQSIEVC